MTDISTIILCAGNGTRMQPLSLTTPKPLIPILNKPIIQWQIEAVSDFSAEIVVVLNRPDNNPLQALILEFLEKYPNVKIAYQEEARGTADAVLAANSEVAEGNRILVLSGDDLYDQSDLENLVKVEAGGLCIEVADPRKFNVFETDGDRVLNITEKPDMDGPAKSGIGAFILPYDIFDILENLEPNAERGEYELPSAVNILAKETEVAAVEAKGFWLPVGYPWHIVDAHEKLSELGLIKHNLEGVVEDGVVVEGNLTLGKGSVIKNGTRIEGDVVIGDDCVVGPNAYIRGTTVIGNGSKIGAFVEIKNTTVLSGSSVPHVSHIGDSVLGNNVNIGGGASVANLRHDASNVSTMVKHQLVDTGRKKFGIVVGDGAKIGIKSSFYPGRKVWPGQTTLPGEVIKRDVRPAEVGGAPKVA